MAAWSSLPEDPDVQEQVALLMVARAQKEAARAAERGDHRDPGMAGDRPRLCRDSAGIGRGQGEMAALDALQATLDSGRQSGVRQGLEVPLAQPAVHPVAEAPEAPEARPAPERGRATTEWGPRTGVEAGTRANTLVDEGPGSLRLVGRGTAAGGRAEAARAVGRRTAGTETAGRAAGGGPKPPGPRSRIALS